MNKDYKTKLGRVDYRANLDDRTNLNGDEVCIQLIEEGLIQKARQTVVVSVWGARSYAAMGIFVLNVQYCVHGHCNFPFTFVWGGGRGDALCVDLYFKFKDRFYYFDYYFIY